MRVLGFPLESPQTILNRIASDVAAMARFARAAPRQLERILELGEEIAGIGRDVLDVAQRLDLRAENIMALGERLDGRGQELIDLGSEMRDLGAKIDERGGEIVEGATRVADTGGELITVLPVLERAIEMTTPLEGAIDRFGRLVDRLPGGAARRRAEPHPDGAGASPYAAGTGAAGTGAAGTNVTGAAGAGAAGTNAGGAGAGGGTGRADETGEPSEAAGS